MSNDNANSELSMFFSTKAEEDQFLADGNLEALMKRYQPSELSLRSASATTDAKTVKGARDNDILIGRFVSHPGNILARVVITSNREYFRTLDTEDRKRATDCMIAFFESKGSRFLEPIGSKKHNDVYRLASYMNVVEKFRKSLRETGYRADRPHLKKKVRLPKKPVPVKATKKSVKKPPPTTRSRTTTRTRSTHIATTSSSSSSSTHSHSFAPPAGTVNSRRQRSIQVGDRLAIYWPHDEVYYPGTVLQTLLVGNQVKFQYDDDVVETIDLHNHQYVVLGKTPRDPKVAATRHANTLVTIKTNATTTTKSKSRRVSLPATTSRSSTFKNEPSPDNSVTTKESSTASSASSISPRTTQAVPVHLEGSFQKAQAAPVLSLASFLRNKLNKATTTTAR